MGYRYDYTPGWEAEAFTGETCQYPARLNLGYTFPGEEYGFADQCGLTGEPMVLNSSVNRLRVSWELDVLREAGYHL